MGSWFANYFSSRKAFVSVYDRNRASLQTSPMIAIAHNLKDCVKEADLVLVCVPVRQTPGVIRECSTFMKSGSLLGEISSVKHRSFSALSKVREDIEPLCIHPMFGPGATEKSQLKILLVPVRNAHDELKRAKDFFDGIKLVVIPSARDHDDVIGIVLGLTYFSNLVLADFLSTKDLKLLDMVSGTTFKLQSMLAQSILVDDPELISVLIRDNPQARGHMKQYLKKALALLGLASTADAGKLQSEIKSVRNRLKRQADLERSYKRLYAAIQATEG